ncbi:MAG TPA: NHLP leader peptide family RiPP precursor [Verrucomicrobiaceae bacterium]|jgi:hypothetical protein
MNQKERETILARLTAKCWADEEFKKRILDDPMAVLAAEGIEIPAGIKVCVWENSDRIFHLVLPTKPTAEELSDEQLDSVSGGLLANAQQLTIVYRKCGKKCG